ncbi:hypothetical protein MTO96_043016 [Rhipicephalus appendiculatus]
MVSSTVALHGLVVAVLAVIACSGEEQTFVPGGWQKHNVGDDAIYEELAHFAVSKQVANREFFDTVLEIVDVESQTVAGTNYRIKFKTTESTCPITGAYNKATCLPKSREVTMVSSTVVFNGFVMAMLAVIVCSGEDQIPVFGGWQKHNVGDNAIYEDLAHFAVSKQVANREFFRHRTRTRRCGDAGSSWYKLPNQVQDNLNQPAELTDVYSKTACVPKSRENIKDVCTAMIVDPATKKERELLSFTCEGSTASH